MHQDHWFAFVLPALCGGLAGYLFWRGNLHSPLGRRTSVLFGLVVGLAPALLGLVDESLLWRIRAATERYTPRVGTDAFVRTVLCLLAIQLVVALWGRLFSALAAIRWGTNSHDLDTWNWSTSDGRRQFTPRILQRAPKRSAFRASNSRGGAGEVYAKVCTACGDVHPLDPCPECGGDGFVVGRNAQKEWLLNCFKCGSGFGAWECKRCGEKNPVNASLGRRRGRRLLAKARK
jgi:hypothetical protein